MKYYELPNLNHFTASFKIGSDSYSAEFRILSTSKKLIWSVRNTEGIEIFKNLYLVSGINYAGCFPQFGDNKTIKLIISKGVKYLATEG